MGVGIVAHRVCVGEKRERAFVPEQGCTDRMFGARTTLPKMRALSAAIFLGVLALMASLPGG